MKERLIQLLDLEQLTPSKFADIIGVQRSSVSHVISGRNNPSFDFLQKTLSSFPGLNAEWLILGKGSMYEQMGRPATGNLFDVQEKKIEIPDEDRGSESEKLPEEEGAGRDDHPKEAMIQDTEKTEKSTEKESVTRRISRVILFYDDDTFVSFDPS